MERISWLAFSVFCGSWELTSKKYFASFDIHGILEGMAAKHKDLHDYLLPVLPIRC